MKHTLKPKSYWLLLAALGSFAGARAQVDPHFSQYYIHPMTMNPALTGAIEGDYRVTAVFRNQYDNTLQTRGISGEVTTNKNANFGFNLMNQATNDKIYNYTTGYLTFAYTGVRFGANADKYLVMAIQGGFMNRLFDQTRAQYGSQWKNGLGYDVGTPSNEVINRPSVSAFDAGAGILYYDATPNAVFNSFAGFSAYHITRPPNPAISDGSGDRMDVRYTAHVGARILASDMLSIVPSAIYMREGKAEEKMLGSYFQVYVNESTDVMFGAYYRINDAVAPFAGFYYKGFTLGVSYDVNASYKAGGLTKTNSLEVSLSFEGKSKSGMPTKSFFCPRF